MREGAVLAILHGYSGEAHQECSELACSCRGKSEAVVMGDGASWFRSARGFDW